MPQLPIASALKNHLSPLEPILFPCQYTFPQYQKYLYFILQPQTQVHLTFSPYFPSLLFHLFKAMLHETQFSCTDSLVPVLSLSQQSIQANLYCSLKSKQRKQTRTPTGSMSALSGIHFLTFLSCLNTPMGLLSSSPHQYSSC